jgi:hypothetical protein
MASAAYGKWIKDGKPVQYGRAAKALADNLRAHGLTVYMIGNERHLTHEPPEDHTPFSATGWPGNSPYPYCLALDIMPPAPGQRSKLTGKPLPSLQRISRQIFADRQSGVPGAAFVKYMNWEPERDNGGPCWQDSWKPTHVRRASTDRGHTHISSRTDFAHSPASDGYDPIARIMGDDDDMALSTDEITVTASLAKRLPPKDAKTGAKYVAGDKISAATVVMLTAIWAKDALDATNAIDKDLGVLLSPEAPAADKAEAVRTLLGDSLAAVLAELNAAPSA